MTRRATAMLDAFLDSMEVFGNIDSGTATKGEVGARDTVSYSIGDRTKICSIQL